MIELVQTGMPREVLLHIAFVLIALAFIVRDTLVLHSRAVVAYCFLIGFASTAAGGPAWHLIGWYVLFLLINCGQVIGLLRERYFDRLTDEQKRLAELAFPALETCAVKRIVRCGHWATLRRGELLTERGNLCGRMFVIVEGEVLVSMEGNQVCRLGPGQFVGEMGFITNSPATATAVVQSEKARVVSWCQSELRSRFAGRSELSAVIHAAIGADLARKIADQTIQAYGNRCATALPAEPAESAPTPRIAA